VFDEVERLFDSARSRGGIGFVYTLLRVEGMSFAQPDPLLPLRKTSSEVTAVVTDDARRELLKILGNLLRCVQGLAYRGFPAGDEHEQRREIAAAARVSGYDEIAAAVEGAERERDGLVACLFDAYWKQRRAALESRRLYKLPGFDVLEVLFDEEVGLTGFRVHFSNDSFAEFRRTDNSTMPLNLTFGDDGEIIFNVGDIDALTDEWRIGGRALFEVGLEGRYNTPGEWKPLVYPAGWDRYSLRAKEASERPEVQGALLYMFLTGHHAVEFAVRTSVELPHELTSFGSGRLELFKVEPDVGRETIYDGTAYVRKAEATAVEDALVGIQALMNRIAFSFDAAVSWVPKYNTHHSGGTRATPSEDDLRLLDQLLVEGGASRGVIDQAIDWYNRGRSSNNEFVAYLCAYISFESTAMAVWSGDIDTPAQFTRPSKAERKAETSHCVQALHDLEYEHDPALFVRNAYFECVVPVKRRVKQVAEGVFGAESRQVSVLFERRDGSSLADIRGSLAHGGLSLADPAARALVRSRLPEIQEVAREFLLRVALGIAAIDEAPEWSGLHLFGITMDDPRATLCTSSLDHLPPADWRIRHEWID
jgi:hypothetical protein